MGSVGMSVCMYAGKKQYYFYHFGGSQRELAPEETMWANAVNKSEA